MGEERIKVDIYFCLCNRVSLMRIGNIREKVFRSEDGEEAKCLSWILYILIFYFPENFSIFFYI